MGKLTALRVRSIKNPGRYGDGRGLFLEVGASGSRSWVLRIQHRGRRRDIGLGSALALSLSDARTAAEEVRRAIREGRDVVAEKRAARMMPERLPTFREVALRVHGEHKAAWRNGKHGAQWLASLEQHALPALGDRPIDQITGPEVRDVLGAIWLSVPETARRIRQRIGTVLNFAHAAGWRDAPFDVAALSKGLPKQPTRDGHFAALPWREVPGFLAKLAGSDKAGEVVRLGIEFTVLTAARSGEVRGATWAEMDLPGKVWRVPGERMKAGKTHTVPLSPRAMAILARMAEFRTSTDPAALVFASARKGRPLSDMTFTMVLRRMGTDCTMHGFRSAFRDWAAEATAFPREVAEMALAHAVESKVEAAYFRSDLLEKRRKLMDAWAGFCTGGAGTVVALARRRAR